MYLLFVCLATSFDSCAQCYRMLWFDVPTALLWVQRPCSVPGEVVFCSVRQDTAVAKSNTVRMRR